MPFSFYVQFLFWNIEIRIVCTVDYVRKFLRLITKFYLSLLEFVVETFLKLVSGGLQARCSSQTQ